MTSPAKKLNPAAWDALAEALATYEWFKKPFESLVRRLFADAPSVIGRLNFTEPKRRVVGELVDSLRARESEFQGLVIDALVELAQYDSGFPKLARLDDGAEKVAAALVALAEVKAATAMYSQLASDRERIRQEYDDQATRNGARQAQDVALSDLHDEFLKMFASSNPQQRGIAFESFLNRLFALWDLTPRAAYSLAHEQIDGAFTFRTDDYLLEARWWNQPIEPKELNDFQVKVDRKARNTLGLCVAVNGFTAGAVELHSSAQSPMILLDGTDLMPILDGRIGLDEVLERKRRHAAETGNVMFRVGV